jgi:hypothetical protein
MYIMPISGGYFVHQLAMLEWMSDVTTDAPAIVLGSSGGNVAAYLGMASQWKKDELRNRYTYLNAADIWRSWWPDYLPLPTVLKGYFHGSMYRSNPKFQHIFKTWFPNSEILQSTEIWTGTYNKTRGMSHIFCNQSSDSARLKPTPQTNEMSRNLNCQEVTYLNGDAEKIYTVSLASAAVPGIFPSQWIDEEEHNDGGSSFSSPLTPLQDMVRQYLSEHDSYHISYFSSYNMLMSAETVCHVSESNWNNSSIFHQGKHAIQDLIKSLNIQDRKCAIELICHGKDASQCQFEDTVISMNEFASFHAKRMGYSRTLVELYPLSSSSVSLNSFRAYDIIKIIDETTAFGCRMWYFT